MSLRQKLRLIATVTLAASLGVTLGLVVTSGAHTRSPPKQADKAALRDLRRLNARLDHALDVGPKTRVEVLFGAKQAKEEFVGDAFRGQKVAGCDAPYLLLALDTIDGDAAFAGRVGFPGAFGQLRDDTKQLTSKLLHPGSDPCEQADSRAADTALEISRIVDRMERAPTDAHRKQLMTAKESLIAQDRLLGCDAVDFFRLTDSIDTALREAQSPGHYEAGGRALQRYLKKAIKDANDLTDLYKKAPCGEDGASTSTGTSDCTATGSCTPPPDCTATDTCTSTQDCTVTGTCTPPPQCSDGIDNDSNGMTDLNDPGCMSAPDTIERTSTWDFQYPGDGFSITDWFDFKPYFGALVGSVLGYRVFYGPGLGMTVHMSNTPNHGAMPITGMMPCPSLGATGISAGVGNQAPTGGVLPAPPDSDHMRIALNTSDPAGGGTCGNGTTALQVATDTR